MKKLLIVDDEALNIKLLYSELSKDYKVLAAKSGEEGISTAIEKQPDLILLDVMMSGIDGFEVLRRLQLEPQTKRIPVIFITGLNQVSDEEYGLKLGARDYITKPFHMPIVKARINTQMEIIEQRNTIEYMANHDPLTGAPNRQYIQQLLEKTVAQDEHVAILFMDLDRFKEANDCYGHDAGDHILHSVVSRIKQLFVSLGTTSNYIGRMGGDEFLLIVSGVKTEKMLDEVCNQVLAEVRQGIEYQGRQIEISASIGALRANSEQSFQDLKARADKLMYEAKKSMGKQYCIA